VTTYKITLRDLQTGYTRTIEHEYADDGHAIYMWEDGNYSCDCNRSIFLYNLGLDESWPCGEGKILVTEITDDAGEFIYGEVATGESDG
jgi:hypothetical protein